MGLRGNKYKLSHACQAMLSKTVSKFRIFHVPSISICVVCKILPIGRVPIILCTRQTMYIQYFPSEDSPGLTKGHS